MESLDDRHIELEFFVGDPLHGGFSAAEVLDEFEKLGLRNFDFATAGLSDEPVTEMPNELGREAGKILTSLGLHGDDA